VPESRGSRADRSSILIARPIEDVFAVLTDVTKTGRWFPADVEEKWTSPPPHRIGSTRRATVRVLGMRLSNDAVVTAYQPPHRAAMRGLSRSAPFEVELAFAPVGGGTRVEVDASLAATGPMKLLAPAFSRWYGRAWQRGLARLKELMESGRL
jgi:uncharacterized protein YndB with AHSA1/START domain